MIFQEGQRYRDFFIKRLIAIDEIAVTLYELEHEPTGACILHISADDDENLFSLSFQTHPHSSNGIAHILEHTVLCGSKKYPVKDPFFSMTRRSLNTFMNAITGSDFTCYPASSQNPEDFYNLLDVYLDAVFNPRLDRLSFLQEGHRLEFQEASDPTTPLTFKGVVYNEMKGALAHPEARLGEEMNALLFPDLPYRFNSGGEPREILTLTLDELKAFHASYYHPSRCLFFFYGNLPLEKHLDFIEERALKNQIKKPKREPLPPQKRFNERVRKVSFYPFSSEEPLTDKTLVSMGWLTACILEQEEILALSVLELVLMGTDAAPLKSALLQSGLCKNAESTLEDEFSEVPLYLTLKGCHEKNIDALEKVVFDTLTKIANEKIPPHLIEGAVHQLEFARCEITSPFGLSLFFRSALLKQLGANAEDGLKIHTLFKNLREKLKDPNYLPSLIKKHLLDNTHFVRLEMRPDKSLLEREKKDEEEKANAIAAKLSKDEISSIIAESIALEAYQEEEGNVDILPKVSLGDVKREGKEFALKQHDLDTFTLFYHPNFTNGILYADLLFPLPKLSEDELFTLRLFSFFLPQIGSGGRNYKEQLDYLFQYTAGLGVDIELAPQAEEPSKLKPRLILRGKALEKNSERLLNIFYDLITSAQFNDPERLKEILTQYFEELQESLETSSLRFAMLYASSAVSLPGKINNELYGLNFYWKLEKLMKDLDKNIHALIADLFAMKEKILDLKGAELVLSTNEKMASEIIQKKGWKLSQLKAKSFVPWQSSWKLNALSSEGRITSSPVAFTTLLFKSVPYLHPFSPTLSVAAKIMENCLLHRRIREQGGAYGSGANHVPSMAHFYFYSYRDPNIASTVEAFHEAVSLLVDGDFDEKEIEEAKLEIFQDVDAPIAPSSKAITGYIRQLLGRTEERRRRNRTLLFQVSKKEIQEAAKSILSSKIKEGIVISFANKELLERENKSLAKALSLLPLR